MSERPRILNPDGTDMNGDHGRFKITWEKVLTWVIAVLLAWSTVNARVSVLETRVDGLKADVAEIKADVKALLRQIR